MGNPVFDAENPVVKLCTAGMAAEGSGEPENAARLFMEAWNLASDPFEKFTAAHFVARHQSAVQDKLHWDETALVNALALPEELIGGSLSSLYLNIGKCHEDLGDNIQAAGYYQQAAGYLSFLDDDGYGRMIASGVRAGLERSNKDPNDISLAE